MAETVSLQNNITNNPFAEFKSKQTNYYFATQKLPQSSDSFLTEKAKEEKETSKLGKTIALSAVGIGAGILFLMRGLPKNAYKTIEKWSTKLEAKLNTSRENGNVGKFEEFYTFTLNKLGTFLDKAKSINNFVCVKDISFKKLMFKNQFTRKIHEKITDVYEAIGKRTVNKSYDKAKSKIYKMFQTFEDYDDQILLNTRNGEETIDGRKVKEWLDDIENLKTKIRRTWNTDFGKRAREERYKNIQIAVKTLPDDVWEATVGKFDNFTKKDVYETFIAEEQLAGKKLKIINDAKHSRYKITRDIDDIYNSTIDVVGNITSFVNPKDKTARELIKSLRLNLEKYKKLSGLGEAKKRTEIDSEIHSLLQNLSNTIRENQSIYKYDTETVNQFVKNIAGINQILGESGKGALQEILTIYKKLMPREDYLNLKESSAKTVKYIDDAITKETDSFFDMMRDLKMGSAPTDILSILAAIGAIGIGLSKAENKDQQNTVLLKAGIPAVGAIATSLYFSASLVSGGRAMLYGAISGMLISKAGSMLDNYRKKYFPVNENAKNNSVN